MALDPRTVQLHARITALEILVQHLFVIVASVKPDAVSALRAYRLRVLEEYSEATMKDRDPATSDLLAQELVQALDHLLSQTLDRMQESRPPRR